MPHCFPWLLLNRQMLLFWFSHLMTSSCFRTQALPNRILYILVILCFRPHGTNPELLEFLRMLFVCLKQTNCMATCNVISSCCHILSYGCHVIGKCCRLGKLILWSNSKCILIITCFHSRGTRAGVMKCKVMQCGIMCCNTMPSEILLQNILKPSFFFLKGDKISAILKAASYEFEPYWPGKQNCSNKSSKFEQEII